jgi:DNA-binding MarR family transcriptional regulator
VQEQRTIPSPQELRPDPFTAVRRATRSLTHLYDLVLAPTGLRATQFAILRGIAQYQEIAQWRLAREYDLAVETLTRRLAKLRNGGLVSMRIGAAPRRERLYRLTPAGVEKMNAAEPYWNRAEQRLRAQLSPELWEAVLTLADKVASAAQKAEAAKLANTIPIDSGAAARGKAPGSAAPVAALSQFPRSPDSGGPS